MEIIESIAELREALRAKKAYSKTSGFVPTMGYLHAGHESLMKKAREECDLVITSIFVNPTQFGPNEDFDKYPRDIQRDSELCRRAGVDIIFHPQPHEIYPRNASTWVEVDGMTNIACGAIRPGHFRGVTTVVAKLFNIIMPHRAYFGEKDYQQLQVIKRMTRDLFMPITIVPVPTIREADGLAMSSRNSYLSPTERQAARVMPRALQTARDAVESGIIDVSEIISRIEKCVTGQQMATLQYAVIVDPETMEPLRVTTGEARLLLAILIGKTRLIDNIPLIPKAIAPGTI